MEYKKAWLWFSENFGPTIIHPQYIAFRLHNCGLQEAEKYAKGKLIDIGCGRMRASQVLGSQISEYVGVDHPSTVRMYPSDKRPHLLCDASEIPVANNSFDTALMLAVIEHLDKPKEALDECFRILKKDGILIMTIPFMYPIHDAPYDFYRYTPFAIDKMLKKSGFKIIKLYAQGGFLEFWLLSLICFLLTSIRDHLIKPLNLSPIGILKLSLYLPIILLIITPILFFNLIVAIFFPVKKSSSPDNYFPIITTVVAKK